MSRDDNLEYYEMRAETERAAAGNTGDTNVAEVHRLMAFEYDKLIVAAAAAAQAA